MTSDSNDHVWRFAVDAQQDPPVYEDPLIEMVRMFLEDLIGLGFVTHKGKKVQIDGFAFANRPQEVYAIFREEPGESQDD